MKITRRIQFCSGHRVLGHEGKCSNIHGHNYVALFEAEADGLDKIGRVIDFSVLKEKLGGWVMQHWDHKFIANIDDKSSIECLNKVDGSHPVWIAGFNPTAENMADYLLRIVGPDELRDTGVRLTKVTLWETENCFAEVTL